LGEQERKGRRRPGATLNTKRVLRKKMEKKKKKGSVQRSVEEHGKEDKTEPTREKEERGGVSNDAFSKRKSNEWVTQNTRRK